MQIVCQFWQIDGKFCKYLKFTSARSILSWHGGTTVEPDGENIGNIKTEKFKKKKVDGEESTRGCYGNTVSRPSVSGRKLSALGLFQRVAFDIEQCRYVFPVGTKDIHLKIGFFFSFVEFNFKIKNVPL